MGASQFLWEIFISRYSPNKFLINLGVKGAEKYKATFKPKEKGSNLKKKALEKQAKINEEKASQSA